MALICIKTQNSLTWMQTKNHFETKANSISEMSYLKEILILECNQMIKHLCFAMAIIMSMLSTSMWFMFLMSFGVMFPMLLVSHALFFFFFFFTFLLSKILRVILPNSLSCWYGELTDKIQYIKLKIRFFSSLVAYMFGSLFQEDRKPFHDLQFQLVSTLMTLLTHALHEYSNSSCFRLIKKVIPNLGLCLDNILFLFLFFLEMS